jgi:hypothetical protein
VIVFDLRCSGGHVFEAWFASSNAYDEQVASGRLRCPVCDDADVEKAVMAPAVSAKGNRLASPTPATVKKALAAMAAAQAKALRDSTWVGAGFASEARAMHAGEREHSPIHGQVSLAEAKALVEDGVPIAPLPFPIVPPDAIN